MAPSNLRTLRSYMRIEAFVWRYFQERDQSEDSYFRAQEHLRLAISWRDKALREERLDQQRAECEACGRVRVVTA